MRVVHLVDTLEIGGLERLVLDLAIEAQRLGHECVIFCLSRKGPFADEAERAGVRVRCFGKSTGLSPRVLVRMSMALWKHAPQIVHTHNTMVHHYGIVAARLAGVPVVINTRHSGMVDRSDRSERIFGATLPFTSAVVAVSEASKRCLEAAYPSWSEKLHVIRNGIPVARFSGMRALPGATTARIRFGTVARLADVKDHVTLIKAFSLLAERLPRAELYLLGDGPRRASLESLVESLGLSGRVFLVGMAVDTPRFLESLDIFVLSSITEGLPLAILEAMAAGLPIVSTRVGGTPEVAPEGVVAWYCEPGSPQALAEVMLRVATTHDLAAIGSSASRIAQAQFSITTTVQSYTDLYAQMTRPPRGYLQTQNRAAAPHQG